jgi:hypothetical protein
MLDGDEWFTSRPDRFFPGKEPRYPLNRRRRGPQSWLGRFGEEKYLLPLSGIPVRIVQPVVFQSINARCQNTISAYCYGGSTSAQFREIMNPVLQARRHSVMLYADTRHRTMELKRHNSATGSQT